jgi:ABC-type lipoprotein release transport system permease subunit
MVAGYFEPIIDGIINEQFQTGIDALKGQLDALKLEIGFKNLLLTGMLVMIASIFGAIVPTIMAMRVDPMDQLRTQL